MPMKSAVTDGMGLNVLAKMATAARISTMKNKRTQAIGYVFGSGKADAAVAVVAVVDESMMVV